MLWFFAVSLFVSSTLLFLVQPIIGKMILPLLGGTPAVWNTCMVFFQAVLLVGYAYTHSLSTWNSRRRQVVVHLALLGLPLLFLPFSLGDWEPPTEHNPVFAVLWLLLGLVGLPFFVVATSAPLLQKWFTHTGHPAAKDPYFLYGASNLGSMLALVLYPVVVEPYFALDAQSTLWTCGYGLLLGLVVMCGLLVWWSPTPPALALESPLFTPEGRGMAPPPTLPSVEASAAVQPAKKHRRRGPAAGKSFQVPPVPDPAQPQRLRWLGLAAVPLSVLLVVTHYLSQHLAAEAILWAIGWGVYALGFLFVCRNSPWKWLEDAPLTFLLGQPMVLVGFFVLLLFSITLPAGIMFVLSLVVLLIPLYFLCGKFVGQAAGLPGTALGWWLRGIGLAAALGGLFVLWHFAIDFSFWVRFGFFLQLSLVMLLYFLCGGFVGPAAGVPAAVVTLGRRLRWVGLAAAPSSLMLGITTYLTTDIASIPLFWVIPLALYLLTFILVFLRWPVTWVEKPHTAVLWIGPLGLIALVLIVVGKIAIPMWALFLLHILVFFLTALVCHGELARDRPAPAHLTEYYLWMSVGGVAGGLFNGLLAPMFFWFGVVEYPLAGLLAILLRPSLVGNKTLIPGDSQPARPTSLGLTLDFLLPFAVGVVSYVILGQLLSNFLQVFFLVLVVSCCLALFPRPLRAGLGLAALLVAAHVQERSRERYILESRGFYGFLRIKEGVDHHGLVYHYLLHGGINHGAQYLYDSDGNLLPEPLRRKAITYFTPASGIGQIFETWKPPPPPRFWSLIIGGAASLGIGKESHSEPPYAVVGLGIGTLATHARPNQHVTFYEIDPAVIDLSEGDEPYFYYVKDARERGAKVDLIPGDGLLTLKKAPDRYFHVLVLDAFSSDAIPVHLLTDEAVKLYLKKLVDGGILIFNTTNRYVDIKPVLADLADNNDLMCIWSSDHNEEDVSDQYSSDWIVMQRRQYFWKNPDGNSGPGPLARSLRLVRKDPKEIPWKTLRAEATGRFWKFLAGDGNHLWTEKYSNVLKVLSLRIRSEE